MGKMRKGRQAGFTMVDLMIGAAMLGIVAAVAIPVYQDYTVRTQVTEGMALAAPVQARVAEIAAAGATADRPLAQGYATGQVLPAATRHVQSVEVVPESGVVTIAYQPRLAPTGQNLLVLQPLAGLARLPAATRPFAPVTAEVSWRCLAAGARPPTGTGMADAPRGTLHPRFAPAECR